MSDDPLDGPRGIVVGLAIVSVLWLGMLAVCVLTAHR